jgi:hypothetical protein
LDGEALCSAKAAASSMAVGIAKRISYEDGF